MRFRLPILLAAISLPSPALAQTSAEPEEEEAICADRPGIASSTCTVPASRVQVELAVDWSFQEEGGDRSDTLLAGDTLVRVGVGERTELQFGWTAYGRVRDRTAGIRSSDESAGDAMVGVRHRFFEQGDVSAAVQGRLLLPVGGSAIGAGDWGFDLEVPVEISFGSSYLLFTPALGTTPDADRRGRHLSYGMAAGFGFNLSERLSTQLDLALYRDDDPLGASTEAVAGLGLAYAVSNNLQLDVGAIVGLNRDSADLEIYLGAASRF